MWSVATLKATRGEGNEGTTFITHETMSNGVVQDSNRTASVHAPRAPGRRDAVESAFTSPPRVPRRRPPWLVHRLAALNSQCSTSVGNVTYTNSLSIASTLFRSKVRMRDVKRNRLELTRRIERAR